MGGEEKMTELELQRGPQVPSVGIIGIQGQISCTVDDKQVFGCLALENQDHLCPPGKYQLKNAPMVSHGGVIRAELQDVPGREGIFIHSIEKAADSLGCIGVGDYRITSGTLGGGILHHIADKIAALVAADPENSWITIISKAS